VTIEVGRFDSLEELSRFAAELVRDEARERIEAAGRFSLALSGGRTPRRLYELLVREPIAWDRVHLFWGDERCLPPESPESNVGLAQKALLSRITIPAENVHPPRIFGPDCRGTAGEYEAELGRCFGTGDLPRFDLILLGLGEDGHVASLFPGEAALTETERWVVRVEGLTASPPLPRLTFTLPVINQARTVAFLVAGEAKRAVVEAVIGEAPEAARFPAARVKAAERLVWLVAHRPD
jgi:6-phosphogluconolactonase